ncbi:MAG: hypothetical protein JWM64_2820 [Frankiales bacterium]|nr:hypothetical protein [Frankiales bacterium]
MTAFFEPLSDPADPADSRWRATEHTAGPWDPASQHGGPPSALLGRAVERCAPRDDLRIARVTVEILGAVPVGDLELRARVARPGRSVELVEAALSAGGRDVARASAWRVRRTEGVTVASRARTAPPLPDTGEDLPGSWGGGYLRAVEWRFVAGRFDLPGPAAAWTRMRLPLVPDEEPSPLQRVLVVADSGNGLSSELDLASWFFINPELTVHSSRDAVGEWVCLDAQTTVSDGGSGLATSVLSDVEGPVAVGAQSLLVAPR